ASVKPGGKTDFPAVTSDYLPTILEVVGAKLSDARPMDGVSLLPVLEGKPVKRRQPIGFESRNQVALSGDRYKLVGKTDADRFELYDLIADPGESKDISAEHPEIVRRMQALLNEWRESCKRSEAGADYQR
ncbi:MAG: N-acetylgalactosamine 6-sulfate sulfatase, partial [bacterium]|nr:N-acetylgalactosamine 6-sulfate sulfatase [bacterium]